MHKNLQRSHIVENLRSISDIVFFGFCKHFLVFLAAPFFHSLFVSYNMHWLY